jgi:hypothetical protein
MNDAHLHLITNHLPIITPLIGCIILIAGVVLRKELIKRTAYFLFMGSDIFTLIIFSTGENAEEVFTRGVGAGFAPALLDILKLYFIHLVYMIELLLKYCLKDVKGQQSAI